MLAVSSTHPVITHAGKFQAKTLAARIPKRAWQRLSAGAGAKGERYYDWGQAEVHGPAGEFGQWCLLVRRNRRTGELAFYRCFSPRPVPMSEPTPVVRSSRAPLTGQATQNSFPSGSSRTMAK